MSDRPFIDYKDRNRHIYIAGASQHGKSTLLEHIVVQDIHVGAGITLLDPKSQGPLANIVLHCIPAAREKDVVYLDIANPIPIDIMTWATDTERTKLQGELFSTFTTFSPPGAGDQWPNILRATINALLIAKSQTFLDINKMLLNDTFRENILARVQENNLGGRYEELIEYWISQFPSRRRSAEDPILSRMNQILFSPLVNLLRPATNAIHIRDIIRDRKIPDRKPRHPRR
jgi:hypothetical protein